MNEVEEKHKISVNNVNEESQVFPVTDLKRHLLVRSERPYQDQKSNFIIKSMKKKLKTLLTDHVKTDIAFQDKQLSPCFNFKDKTKFPHKHDLVYHSKCADKSCNDEYVGEMTRHISERVLNHSAGDQNSNILKHQIEKELPCPQYGNLLVVASVITLRKENYQKRCRLTLLHLP